MAGGPHRLPGGRRHEGWTHNRVRLPAASFLARALYVDWRTGARHFLRFLVDGDLLDTLLNRQWAAQRVLHPVLQGKRPAQRVLHPVLQGKRPAPDGRVARCTSRGGCRGTSGPGSTVPRRSSTSARARPASGRSGPRLRARHRGASESPLRAEALRCG
ncbi:FAD-binding domain-containing protein [Streptomyces hawaiiensis]|uniref:FAD-binding domain-containing protein n=1 Tax=Streptomyces hawaiiensis TaxID=67305 RepID=UPI003656BFC2